MILRILIIAVFCLLPLNAYAGVHGIFVWSLEDDPVFTDPVKIREVVRFAREHDIRTLFVQIYRANQAWFPSKVSDTSLYDAAVKKLNADPFALLIEEAHKEGIDVHAWINVLSLSANTEAPILKKYGPTILTRNKDPKTTLEDYRIDNQFFLEPSDPRVRQELVTLVEEILRAYPQLDGLQFDYIRYPDVHPFYGYSPDNIARYKKATGVTEVIEEDPKWKQWKRTQVTELLKMLVKHAREVNPNIHLSTTGCLSYSRAMDEALQEWPKWISNNLVEFVTVMNYPPDFEHYKKNVDEVKLKVPEYYEQVNMAVGTYKFLKDPKFFGEQWKYCLESEPRSCVIFHYNDFLTNKELEKEL